MLLVFFIILNNNLLTGGSQGATAFQFMGEAQPILPRSDHVVVVGLMLETVCAVSAEEIPKDVAPCNSFVVCHIL